MLIIHPSDPTTDFLRTIYEGLEHSLLTFFVTRIGCDIAGFRNEQRVYTVKA